MTQVDSQTALDDLLSRCTVKLIVPGGTGWGTGFFVAPGKILTCAHVVKAATTQPIKVCWQGKEDFAEATVIGLFPDPIDIALLEFEASDLSHPCVYLDEAVPSEDRFYTYGYPEDYRDGAPVTAQGEGWIAGNPPMIKFKAGQFRPGISGSPLLSRTTCKICGIIKFTNDPSIDLGGGAVSIATVFDKFSELKKLQKQFHQKDRRWRNLLPLVRCRVHTAILSGLGIGLIVSLVRFVGIFQPVELWAFDRLMAVRPAGEVDDRLLIIEITEEDISWQRSIGQNLEGSISDALLKELIDRLETFEPQAIGLDIYRDHRTKLEMQSFLNNNERLFAVCKAPDSTEDTKGNPPPENFPPSRLGFSDFVSDDSVRRQLLEMNIEDIPAGTLCHTRQSLNLILAQHYLEGMGFEYRGSEGHSPLQFGEIVLHRFAPPYTGGYQVVDWEGYQILLNYRSVCESERCSPNNIAKRLSLRQVVEGKLLEASDVKNRIVLIGSTARSLALSDFHETPYGEMSGLIIQAQMISQLISFVEHKRPLIQPWSFWIESLWICTWSLVGSGLAWQMTRRSLLLTTIGSVMLLGLPLGCWFLLLVGSWVPLVPPTLAVGLSSGWIVYQTARLHQPRRQLKS